MTHELTMVVYTAILLFIMIGFQGGVGLLNNGLKWGGGARDVAAKPSVLHGRATRAVRNHIEALCMFVPIVLALNAAGISMKQQCCGRKSLSAHAWPMPCFIG